MPRHAEIEQNDHWEDAPHFIILAILCNSVFQSTNILSILDTWYNMEPSIGTLSTLSRLLYLQWSFDGSSSPSYYLVFTNCKNGNWTSQWQRSWRFKKLWRGTRFRFREKRILILVIRKTLFANSSWLTKLRRDKHHKYLHYKNNRKVCFSYKFPVKLSTSAYFTV